MLAGMPLTSVSLGLLDTSPGDSEPWARARTHAAGPGHHNHKRCGDAPSRCISHREAQPSAFQPEEVVEVSSLAGW